MTTSGIKMVPRGEKTNIYIHYLRGRLCENVYLFKSSMYEEIDFKCYSNKTSC